ncbi:hypothetical protein [Floridanema evergladense]|uniref:Uncharacterized protein n=1 Tax=Floridaenema evergladense BLCC-F167 TaxID=3153639 RepID=A0ABV4WKR2_9CYAN
MIFLKSQSQQAAKKVNFTMDGLVGELTEAELEMVVGGAEEKNTIALNGCTEEGDESCANINSEWHCHFLENGIKINNDDYKGVCVPKKMTADGLCPQVGNHLAGVIFGTAQEDEGICEYSKFSATSGS